MAENFIFGFTLTIHCLKKQEVHLFCNARLFFGSFMLFMDLRSISFIICFTFIHTCLFFLKFSYNCFFTGAIQPLFRPIFCLCVLQFFLLSCINYFVSFETVIPSVQFTNELMQANYLRSKEPDTHNYISQLKFKYQRPPEAYLLKTSCAAWTGCL